MSEHSVDELRRQWEAAEARTRQAQVAEAAARLRYGQAAVAERLAAFAAQGIVAGVKVRLIEEGGVTGVFGFAGVDIGIWGHPRVKLTKLKADGTVGRSPTGIRVSPRDRLERAE